MYITKHLRFVKLRQTAKHCIHSNVSTLALRQSSGMVTTYTFATQIAEAINSQYAKDHLLLPESVLAACFGEALGNISCLFTPGSISGLFVYTRECIRSVCLDRAVHWFA